MVSECSFSCSNGMTLELILSQLNPDHTSSSYYPEYSFNIILPLKPISLTVNYINVSVPEFCTDFSSHHVCYMSSNLILLHLTTLIPVYVECTLRSFSFRIGVCHSLVPVKISRWNTIRKFCYDCTSCERWKGHMKITLKSGCTL